MPKKPSPVLKLPTFDDFGMPSSADLQQVGVVSDAISKIIAVDEAVVKFHHKMVHHGIACRVELALAIFSDKKAFANFAEDAHIKALPRPPKDASDTLRCLLQATYPDPKKASKYYKRLEPLWIKRCSAEEVLAFLEKHGVTKTSPKEPPTLRMTSPGKPFSAATTSKKAVKASAESSAGRDRVSAPEIDHDTPAGGSFSLWEGETIVDHFYDLRVKVVDHVGEATIFESYDVAPARVQ